MIVDIAQKKKNNFLFKLIIAALLLISIFFSINKKFFAASIQSIGFVEALHSNLTYCIIIILLMPLNWFFESKKWQLLMDKNYSNTESLKVVLTGLSFGLITPMRVGEYYGRLLLIRSIDKSNSLLATLLSSLAQNIVTTIFGLLGLLYLMNQLVQDTKVIYFLVTFTVLGILILSLLYFNIEKYTQKFSQFKIVKKWLSSFTIDKFSIQVKAHILSLSTIRYLIYLSQYLLMFVFFSIEADSLMVISGITIIFLLQSLIPLPAFLGLLWRVELSLLVWTNLGVNAKLALSMAGLIWVINLCIPSLVGMIYILKMKKSS